MTTTIQPASGYRRSTAYWWTCSPPMGATVLPGLIALCFTGRRSGQRHPARRYAAAGTDVMVLVGRSAAKRWWRNFLGGHHVEVLLDGRWRQAVGEVVTTDRVEYPRLLASYLARHRRVPRTTQDPIVHIRLL